MSTVDQIVNLADVMADYKAGHQTALQKYCNDQGSWTDVERMAEKFIDAQKALRDAVYKAIN